MTNTIAPAAAWSTPPVAVPASIEPPPGTPYQHLFREPGRRWWRPLVSLAILVGSYLAVLLVVGVGVGLAVAAALSAYPDATVLTFETLMNEGVTGWASVVALLVMNLALAALIPAVLIANRIAHRMPVGYTHSVAGRFRFGWFGLVVAALAPLWVVYLALSQVFEPIPLFSNAETPAVTAALVAVVLLTTPLQCAGEEYAMRGWLLQNIGVAIPRPLVALVVPTVVSAVVFSALHGSLDPWIITSLVATSVAACWVTWRTGGLEAAVALHTVNNVSIFLFQAAFGVPLMSAIITDGTTGTWLGALLGVTFNLLAVPVVAEVARRRGINPTR